jgi:hypothetical protein
MADLPKNLPPDVAAALSRGNVIEAIKLLRGKYNIGLAEAKSLLEALQKQAKAGAKAASAAKTEASMHHASAHHPTTHVPHAHQHHVALMPDSSHLSPGEMPRSSSGTIFAAVVLGVMFVIGTAIYFSR